MWNVCVNQLSLKHKSYSLHSELVSKVISQLVVKVTCSQLATE